MFKKSRYFLSDARQGIKNLIEWFPIIWKDRWWDHWFIYAVLHRKLSLMEHNFRHHGVSANRKHDADKIKLCVLLLERLRDDNYFEMAYKQHHEKWGEPEFDWIDTDDPDLVELKIKHDNVITEEDKKQERKEFKTATEHENYLRQQDLEMLFGLMRKHIQCWWD